jgi:hypothetical protein
LNGKAVRVLHPINDSHGGESLVMWDEEKKAVAYHYFTTAGFRTTGTMTFKDGKILSHEVVTGNAGGVTEVRGTFEMRSDGTMHVKTEHLKDGEWTTGRETTYREDQRRAWFSNSAPATRVNQRAAPVQNSVNKLVVDMRALATAMSPQLVTEE